MEREMVSSSVYTRDKTSADQMVDLTGFERVLRTDECSDFPSDGERALWRATIMDDATACWRGLRSASKTVLPSSDSAKVDWTGNWSHQLVESSAVQ